MPGYQVLATGLKIKEAWFTQRSKEAEPQSRFLATYFSLRLGVNILLRA